MRKKGYNFRHNADCGEMKALCQGNQTTKCESPAEGEWQGQCNARALLNSTTTFTHSGLPSD